MHGTKYMTIRVNNEEEDAGIEVDPVPTQTLVGFITSLPQSVTTLDLGGHLRTETFIEVFKALQNGCLPNLMHLSITESLTEEGIASVIEALQLGPFASSLRTMDLRTTSSEIIPPRLRDLIAALRCCAKLEKVQLAFKEPCSLSDWMLLMELIIDGRLPNYLEPPTIDVPTTAPSHGIDVVADAIVRAFDAGRFRQATQIVPWSEGVRLTDEGLLRWIRSLPPVLPHLQTLDISSCPATAQSIREVETWLKNGQGGCQVLKHFGLSAEDNRGENEAVLHSLFSTLLHLPSIRLVALEWTHDEMGPDGGSSFLLRAQDTFKRSPRPKQGLIEMVMASICGGDGRYKSILMTAAFPDVSEPSWTGYMTHHGSRQELSHYLPYNFWLATQHLDPTRNDKRMKNWSMAMDPKGHVQKWVFELVFPM